MKKIFLVLFAITLILFLGACDNGGEQPTYKPKTIEILGTKDVMEVGEEISLSAKVSPEKASQEVVWSSSDDKILEVMDQGGKIKAVGAGIAQVIVTSKVDTRISRKVSIVVNEPIVYDAPESIKITSTRAEVGIGIFITVTAQVLPLSAKQEIVWSSSDQSVATVTSEGRVYGHSLGIATITATAVADPSISVDFMVSVIEQADISETKPQEIIITGENNVIEGNAIFLTANILPHGASLTVFWTSSDDQIATVNNHGKVMGLKPGVVQVTATSAVDTSIYKNFLITVKPEPYNEPAPNLQKYTITILTNPGRTFEYNPFDTRYIPSDKQAKQRAWTEVEDLYNCKIVLDEFPDTAAWGSPRVTWVNTTAATNKHTADIMILTTQWISDLVNAGSVVDVMPYYEMYGRNQMPTAMRQAATLRSGLYAMMAESPGSIYVDQGMYYNVNLVETLGLDSPAQIFNDGEWTYSRFIEYVRTANSVMSEEQSVLSGKPSLYWIGMTNAAGVKLLDTVTLTVNFKNQYARAAASTLREAYLIAGWGTNGYDENVESFTKGNSIFQSGEFWFPKEPQRWREDLWGEGTTRFGYVPYPRPDDISLEDTRTNGGDGVCYMLVTGVGLRPSYVTEANIYRAWTEVVLRTAKYMEEDPTYNEDVAMKRTAEFKLDEEASVEAMVFFKRDKLIFDPIIYGVLNYATISPYIDNIVMNSQDYIEVMDTIIGQYRDALEGLYG